MADMENEEFEEMTPSDKRAVAESEFDRWADAWELDTDFETMTVEDQEDFLQAKRKICNVINRGRAVVNQKGNIVYTLKQPVGALSELEFTRGRGASYWDMDKGRDQKNIAKLNHFISAAIGQPNSVLLKMDTIDVKFLYTVFGLFLGS